MATSSVASEMPLPLAMASSSSLPASLRADHDDQPLVEEVLKEFDPAHCLQELGAAWASLQAGVICFDEKF